MLKHRYRPGDVVVLKARVLGARQPDGRGEIISLLPETRGLNAYRVRFEQETFERSIGEDDIDPDTSSVPRLDPSSRTSAASRSSWINSNSIRMKK
ncbi:cold-shock protein [Rhizobium alvei]|uniref:Cold-shock protein n=1 Tax=Rhizobium alvei TaxID=1132659 RepID=A0ABT8YI39_9HYPH|nr:cold-shock protein [Rhizobium alvei]MDO6963231.1 cold-shock protein [Rhizobium alvei]